MTEFISDEACIGPLGKLDCLCSKKKSFQLTNKRFLAGFRGGPILILPFQLLTISTHESSIQLITLILFLLLLFSLCMFHVNSGRQERGSVNKSNPKKKAWKMKKKFPACPETTDS